MTTFKKVLNLKCLSTMLMISILSSGNIYPYTVSKDNLRVPISRDSYDRQREALASGHTLSRRTMLAGLLTGGATTYALFPEEANAAVKDTKPVQPPFSTISSDTTYNNQDIAALLKELGFSQNAVYGDRDKKIPNMSGYIDSFLKQIGLPGFRDKYAKIKTSNANYGSKLRDLVEELFLAYNTDNERGYKEPPPSLLMQLISGFNTEHNIFKVIEMAPNIDENVKKRIANEFLRCSSKAMLGYILLESISIDNVYSAASPEHVFTIIEIGGGLYIIADFSLGVFRIIDISKNSKQYYRKGNYCFLKEDYKISDSKVANLRAVFKRDGLTALNRFSEQELLNLFYPYVYVSPRLDLEGRRKGPRSFVRMERGLAFEDIGFTGEALKEYEEARQSDPLCSETLTNLAKGFLSAINIGRRNGLEKEKEDTIRNEAFKMLEEAVRLNPMNSAAHNGLGNIESLQANWEKAIGHFTESLKLDGYSRKSIDVYCNLGDAYRLSGSLQIARKFYEDGLKVFSQDPMLIFKLGLTFYGLGDYREAHNWFERANRLTKGKVWDILHWQGMNYLKLPGSNEDKAVQCFVQAGRLSKESLSLLEKEKSVPDNIRRRVLNELKSTLVSKMGLIIYPVLRSL